MIHQVSNDSFNQIVEKCCEEGICTFNYIVENFCCSGKHCRRKCYGTTAHKDIHTIPVVFDQKMIIPIEFLPDEYFENKNSNSHRRRKFMV